MGREQLNDIGRVCRTLLLTSKLRDVSFFDGFAYARGFDITFTIGCTRGRRYIRCNVVDVHGV